jgi:hypothetical protein
MSADYDDLLRSGECSGATVRMDTEEQFERWLERVAEPWFASIQAQADRDGLRIMTFAGHANDGRWIGNDRAPAARLLRPDGSDYEGKAGWKREAREHALLTDWGELLTSARERAGVHVPPPPRHWWQRRRKAAFQASFSLPRASIGRRP